MGVWCGVCGGVWACAGCMYVVWMVLVSGILRGGTLGTLSPACGLVFSLLTSFFLFAHTSFFLFAHTTRTHAQMARKKTIKKKTDFLLGYPCWVIFAITIGIIVVSALAFHFRSFLLEWWACSSAVVGGVVAVIGWTRCSDLSHGQDVWTWLPAIPKMVYALCRAVWQHMFPPFALPFGVLALITCFTTVLSGDIYRVAIYNIMTWGVKQLAISQTTIAFVAKLVFFMCMYFGIYYLHLLMYHELVKLQRPCVCDVNNTMTLSMMFDYAFDAKCQLISELVTTFSPWGDGRPFCKLWWEPTFVEFDTFSKIISVFS